MSSSTSSATYIECKVCGDSASNLRFYGASSICYSCRIFFRRIVVSRSFPTKCTRNKNDFCFITILTRNNCKFCRYQKCLDVGLLPYLVQTKDRKPYNISKQKSDQDKYLLPKPSKSIVLSTRESPRSIKEITIDFFEKGQIIGQLTKMHDEIYFSGLGKELAELNTPCIEQIREKKSVISVPPKLMERAGAFIDCFIQSFLMCFIPNLSESCIEEIKSALHLSLRGINLSLFNCYNYSSHLDQVMKSMFLRSDKIKSFQMEQYPDIHLLEPVYMERYDLYKSPFTESIEDEQFIVNIMEQMADIIKGDEELDQLLNLLVIFSPFGVNLPDQEDYLLKQYQQKITMMIYTHLMERENSDNISVLTKMTSLATMIENFHKVGYILTNGLLQVPNDDSCQQALSDCDLIELYTLTFDI